MSLISNLLNRAAEIRDASQEGENSAQRVGGFLVSLVQAIDAALPAKTVDASIVDTSATSDGFVITLHTKDSDGTTGTKTISIPAATESAPGVMTAADKAAIARFLADVAQLKGKVGAAGGIAPLGSDGKVPAANLPELLQQKECVVEFGGMVDGITLENDSALPSVHDTIRVVYDSTANRFVLEVMRSNQIGGLAKYYPNWPDADTYGTGTAAGHQPEPGKVYIDTANNKTYRWDGEALALIGGSDELAVELEAKHERLVRDLAQYPQGEAVALTTAQSGKAVDIHGEVVSKSGYRMSALMQMKKGFIYLFHATEAIAADVALCARYVSEDTAVLIEYSYEYDEDMVPIRATADYDPTLVYERGEDGFWQDGEGNIVGDLPQTRMVSRGSYVPVFKSLSADVPESGYYAVLANEDMMAVWSAPELTAVIPVSYGFIRSLVNQKEDKAVVKKLQERVAELESQLGEDAKDWERVDGLRGMYLADDADVMVVKMRAGSPDIMGQKVSKTHDQWLTLRGVRSLSQTNGWQRDDILDVAWAPRYTTTGGAANRSYLAGLPSVRSIKCTENWMCDCGFLSFGFVGNSCLEEVYAADMFASISGVFCAFKDCTSLKRVHGIGTWQTGGVTSLSSCFFGCGSLEELDLSGWDVGKVTSLQNTFRNCTALRVLNVGGWNVSKVTNINCAFIGCSHLTELDLSGWDVRLLTNVGNAFASCSRLESLDLTGWDLRSLTDNPTTQNSIFNYCYALRYIDISSSYFTQKVPVVLPALGVDGDGNSNGWLEHIVEVAPTIRLAPGWDQEAWDADKLETDEATPKLLTQEDDTWYLNDGIGRTIQLHASLKNKSWAQPLIAQLQAKGFTIA